MFGERLKLARAKAGYSLRGLSEALDREVTAQAIGKYERGEMMPSSGVLMRMAGVLAVSLEYLLSDRVEELEAVEFRKLAGTSVKDRSRVQAEVIDRLQRYLAIEEVLELGSGTWKAPRIEGGFLGSESDAEDLARNLRQEWKLGIDPIPNMTALLEDRGIKILMLRLPGTVSGLTCLVRRPGRKVKVPVIVVNEVFSLERRRLTLAHELAHRLIDAASPVKHEKAANVFAGAFLMPEEHLVREIGKHREGLGYEELIQLKQMYRVSAAALLVRLKQIGVIDVSTLTYAFQTFAKGWRKVEPVELESIDKRGKHERPLRFERLCYRALAEKLISPVRAAELLQQPFAAVERGMKGPAEGDTDRR